KAPEEPLRLVSVVAALGDRGDGRAFFVRDPDEGGGVPRLLEAAGHDDRDRLAGVVDHLVLHGKERLPGRREAYQRRQQRNLVHGWYVTVRQDRGHAVGALSRRRLDRGDPAAGYGGAHDFGVGQAWQCDLAGVARRSGDLRRAVGPRYVLSDESAHRD